ncbi:MAG: DUF5644 domain-containing protein [Campylobacteraceae bacterium]
MRHSLVFNIFRFNAKTDFLPHYKKVELDLDENILLNDALDLIKEKEPNFSYPKNEFIGIRVNGVVTFLDVTMKEVIKKFKKDELTLEPISEFMAVNDLEIKTDDFKQKLAPLKPFTQKEDELVYDELVSYYYASPAYEFDRDIYGDSFFLFSIYLLKKYPEFKKDILKIVADKKHGIWLHVSLNNILFDNQSAKNIDENIAELKREILKIIPRENSTTKRESKRKNKLYM